MTIFLYIRHSISLNLVSCLLLFYEPPLVQTDCRGDAIGPFSISASRVTAPCLAYASPVAPSRSAISVLSYCCYPMKCFLFVSVRCVPTCVWDGPVSSSCCSIHRSYVWWRCLLTDFCLPACDVKPVTWLSRFAANCEFHFYKLQTGVSRE
jgi:hypothetical protein